MTNFVQDRIALSGADIEFRILCPGEDKETLLNVINHRRRAQDRFELNDESVEACVGRFEQQYSMNSQKSKA